MLGIINDILDFSKIEAGKLDIENADFRFEDVLDNLSTVVGQKAQEKNLEFLISAQPDIPPNLVGDPLRLGQILINLVNNAVKFTERGEVIVTVGVEERGRRAASSLKFSVRDTGIGMTPEQSARLFQAFCAGRHFDHAQVRRHRTRPLHQQAAGGDDGRQHLGGERSRSGQHLPLHGLVRHRIGGTRTQARSFPIWPASGLWSWMTMRRRARSSATRCADLRCAPRRSPPDEDAIRALAAADSKDPYQLVLMDWHMPGMDGLQASAIIKREGRLKNIPRIVMVTAFGREDVRVAGRADRHRRLPD